MLNSNKIDWKIEEEKLRDFQYSRNLKHCVFITAPHIQNMIYFGWNSWCVAILSGRSCALFFSCPFNFSSPFRSKNSLFSRDVVTRLPTTNWTIPKIYCLEDSGKFDITSPSIIWTLNRFIFNYVFRCQIIRWNVFIK